LFEPRPYQSLQIVVDHDPRRRRLQLEATHGSRCTWSFLAKGPISGGFVCARSGPGTVTMGKSLASSPDAPTGYPLRHGKFNRYAGGGSGRRDERMLGADHPASGA
jgi:hypothetical protein